MQTQLAPAFANTADGQAAEAILRKCVHCGFCTATCPTYQLLGDELDGPRGRIYLIKQVLEGAPATASTQQHLDRCLTCRNCETTCPSGVHYGELVDIGRRVVDAQVPRVWWQRALRAALVHGLTSAAFAPAMRLGQRVRAWLPAALQAKVPEAQAPRALPTRTHAKKMLLLAGCVQPAMLPNVHVATARVLDAMGIQAVLAPQAGCCGALAYHLSNEARALQQARANIDAWWPLLQQDGMQGLLMNASGCGVMVKDYGHVLRNDPAYAERAAHISAMTRDAAECLPQWLDALQPLVAAKAAQQPALVVHPPCTLQHGQQVNDLPAQLAALGFATRVANTDAHLCCGSAGTYSVLQPKLSEQLRQRKLQALAPKPAEVVVSANVGCITHLQGGASVPVRHWLEVLDDALSNPNPNASPGYNAPLPANQTAQT